MAQSSGCANAADVASQMVRPSRSALDPVGVRNAHARGGAVPGEDDVRLRIGLAQIGNFAIAGMQLGDFLELQFLDDVADPAFAEGFPGDRGDGPCAEQRPQRHLDRAGIGSGHDADLVIGRHFKHLARQFDRELELGLADLRAMRTAERCFFEILRVPAGALGTGAGRKMRHIGPRSGFRCGHDLSFQIASLPLGGGVPPRCIRESPNRQGTSGSDRYGHSPDITGGQLIGCARGTEMVLQLSPAAIFRTLFHRPARHILADPTIE